MMLFRLCLISFSLLSMSLLAAEPMLTMITDIGSSARMVSLGGIDGFGKSSASIFDNPAALFRVRNRSYSLFNTQFINGEVNVLNLAVAERFYGGYLAAGLYRSSVSDIPFTARETTAADIVVVDRFDYNNSVYKVGYQFFWKELSVGTSFSYLSESIRDDSGSGLNMDVGFIWQYYGFDWSLTGKNVLGTSVVYNGDITDNDSVLMPRQISLGTHRSYKNFSFYGQIKSYQGIDLPLKSVAVEYHLPVLMIPVGISISWREFVSVGDVYNSVSMGLGIGLGFLTLNVAYEKSDFVSQDQQYYFSTQFSM